MKIRYFIAVVFLFCVSSIGIGQDGQTVLMKVGSSTVTVNDFKYIYEKNNNTLADYSSKSLNEYIDLFTKFKLKVEKARQLELDTLPELKNELAGYRKQLANTYLMDKEVTETLLKELYERMQSDVSFKHIFIGVDSKSSPEQKKSAKIRMYDIKSKIVGGMSFEEVAQQYSEDKLTASNGGFMGFYTAKLPDGFYELETALYTTSPGEVSDIVTSSIGLHLVKVVEKRPSRGKISISHILLPTNDKNLADSLYNELMNGANFKDLVKNYSIDKNTVRGGGRLSPFGINTYDPVFENAAFSLDKTNKYSKPVLTKAGWHVILFNEKIDPDSYDLFVRRMKSQINKDQRFDIAKSKLVQDIKASSRYVANRDELALFSEKLDEDFYTYKWSPGSAISSNTLMSLGGKSYSVRDFADFCRKNTKTRLQYDKNKNLTTVVDELFEEYVREKAMEYEESQLETKYEDFKNLMREYEEGILLFEATKINVWDKANQDTVGLMAYHSLNKDKYIKNEMVTLHDFILNEANEKLAKKIHKSASKMDVVKLMNKFNKRSTVVTFVEKEVEANDKSLENMPMTQGQVSELKPTENMGWQFSKIHRVTLARPKSLSEARGFIVADYQEYLEKQWMEELSREFPVEINKSVLDKLIENSSK